MMLLSHRRPLRRAAFAEDEALSLKDEEEVVAIVWAGPMGLRLVTHGMFL